MHAWYLQHRASVLTALVSLLIEKMEAPANEIEVFAGLTIVSHNSQTMQATSDFSGIRIPFF